MKLYCYITLSLALSLVPAGCSSKDQSVSDVSNWYEGMEVIATEGIGTDTRSIVFDGSVVCWSGGERIPCVDVTFTRQELPHRDPEVLDIATDSSGRFSTKLYLITTVIGKRRLKRGTTVIIESYGCSAVTLYVDDKWKRRSIELACDAA